MLIEINRSVLEQFVKDREFMYQLVNNWIIETNNHYHWYGVGLDYGRKSLNLRPRGSTQISILFKNFDAKKWDDTSLIEKRILKYKGKRL